MPGGLASWLDDDKAAIKAKLPKPSRGAAAAGVIDVDAASPDATAEGGGKTNCLQAPAEQKAWDPFSAKGACEDASQNAFALLRKGAAAAAPATPTASAPSPTAWREGSRPPASYWDPFEEPLAADGKENRGNAFSKLLAAPTSQQQSSMHKGRSSAGGPGKRTRLNNHGGGSPEADAVTRFCECPVCGKRVIIELCSKHLDTECSGLEIDPGPPLASLPDGPGSVEGLPPAALTAGSSALAVSERPGPRQKPAASVPSFESPKGREKGRSDADSGDSRAVLPSKPADAAPPTMDDPGRPGQHCNASAEEEASGKRIAGNPLTSAAATAGAKSAASRRRKASRDAPPSLRKGRKGSARAAAAAEAKAMTTCPVCGKNVQADLCSWHLDNDCAGVNPAPAVSSVCEDKSTGGVGGIERGAGGEEGGRGSEDAAPKKDAGSEATGGLDALAAELTCPVCLCVFEDVHSLPCSHRFCLECITGCFKSSKRQECPLCKIPAWKRDLTRDVPLQNIILAYRRMAT